MLVESDLVAGDEGLVFVFEFLVELVDLCLVELCLLVEAQLEALVLLGPLVVLASFALQEGVGGCQLIHMPLGGLLAALIAFLLLALPLSLQKLVLLLQEGVGCPQLAQLRALPAQF